MYKEEENISPTPSEPPTSHFGVEQFNIIYSSDGGINNWLQRYPKVKPISIACDDKGHLFLLYETI
jgi:hypothetical protein